MQNANRGVPIWQPQIFDRTRSGDGHAMDALLRSGCVRQTCDEIGAQLEDLVAARACRSLTADDSAELSESLVNKAARYDYGRWIHYPWNGCLVHLLPPPEFRELRLNRNRHKITSLEQERLARSTVAVVGLSAGNVISRTLCLEGICERFKLADFDALALSNLNRLEAGVHELGLQKTVILARRLYEINPYLEISLQHSGLLPEGLDHFLSGSPKPDIVIDECDDLQMKLLLRERARSFRLPVLMATSDRGMIDIERFDLEPERPILHGLVGNVSGANASSLTKEERLSLVLSIVGAEEVSTRAASSMLEINQTVSTWPQLASDVVLGGAAIATAVRRLLLGQPLPSGRRFVDVEATLDGHNRAGSEGQADVRSEPIKQSHAPETHAAPERCFDERLSPLIRFIIEHGCLAPSGGNCQPWRFYTDDTSVWIVHDRKRSKNLMDVGHRASYLALGAAIENMCIAAASRSCVTHVEPFPLQTNKTVVARLSFSPADQRTVDDDARWLDLVRRRVTNRKRGAPLELTGQQAAELSDAAASYGVRVQFATGRDELAQIGRIVGECDRLRFLCPPLHAELITELRWTTADAERTSDGLALETLELTSGDSAILRLLARPEVASTLRELGGGAALAEPSAKAIAGSSAVGLLAVDGSTPAAAVRGGRAFERLWLRATALDLGLQPLGGVTGMMAMLTTDAPSVLSTQEQSTLRAQEIALCRFFPELQGATMLMLFRLSKVPPPSARSRRLPLRRVLVFGRPSEEADDE
jgi:molybdopterin/thiamine biosynthesis adenylyltransferase